MTPNLYNIIMCIYSPTICSHQHMNVSLEFVNSTQYGEMVGTDASR